MQLTNVRLTNETKRWRRELAVALQAATEAGDYFRSRIDNVLEIKTKSSPSDLVTDVDPLCERMIRERIASSFSSHSVLGEETTAPGAAASAEAVAKVSQSAHLWIIDPLDGTTNFVHGLPLSVVSLAYAENGRVCVGVIYDPYRGEMFYAVRGEGAYSIRRSAGVAAFHDLVDSVLENETLPGTRMSVAESKDLVRCIVATGVPTRGDARAWTTEAAIRLIGKVKSFRVLGAAALHLAYVASGRIDAFWEYELNAWDLAAGVLLVEEAGGVVHELGGGTYQLEVRNIVASADGRTATEIEQAVVVPDALKG